jgi:hypothetical protein
MIDVKRILEMQARNVLDWHVELIPKETELPWQFIEENNMWNFSLWHEEDIARIKDIDPLRIVQAKRNIDKFNQSRNNAMEKIDEWILNYLDTNKVGPGEKIHSETPGMMIDRLSIMSLKKYHMLEETAREDASEEHKEMCMKKVQVLEEQMNDLAGSLSQVFDDLLQSRLRFKVYRQLKMYNDPNLNPELYKRKQGQ